MSGIGVRWVVVRFVIIAVALVALASCTGAGTPPASAPPISLLSHPAPNESGIAGFPRPPGLTVFAYGLDGERWSFNAEDRKTFDEVDRSVEALFPLATTSASTSGVQNRSAHLCTRNNGFGGTPDRAMRWSRSRSADSITDHLSG